MSSAVDEVTGIPHFLTSSSTARRSRRSTIRRRPATVSGRSKRFDLSSAANHSGNAKGLVWFPRFTLRTYPSGYAGGKVPGGPVKEFFQLCFF
jgi:hypothetical protein